MAEQEPGPDWQEPFKKAFEEMPEFNLPENLYQYQWREIDPRLQPELTKLAAGYGLDDDIAQNLLVISGTETDCKLTSKLVELAMYQLHQRYWSPKIMEYDTYGFVYTRTPVSIICRSNDLVLYRHPAVNGDQYNQYVQILVEETNYILDFVEKPQLPPLK
ncbi:hypothetical protein HYW46_04615 [Candidatus Daviesbacteria bacterium]|nr:hypothetical protein [Candidatus Daviesbacteria bacterium]